MSESNLTINHVLDSKPIIMPITRSTTAEDVCIHVCKQLNISPLTRHLFTLQTGKHIFAMPAASLKPGSVEFRIRFKVVNIIKLKKIDINAYNYYFHQARKDVLENKIPEISYEKHKRELIGLGITDMYRVMLEKDIPRGTVESEYRKYIPKEVLKRHAFFVRHPIKDTLRVLEKSTHEASYVKAQYIRQLEIIAPDYLSETFKAVIDQDRSIYSIFLKVNSFDIKYSMDFKKDQWEVLCTIEDLCFVSIRNDDRTLMISRNNGKPFYLQFASSDLMYSFISLLDGYYRLTCKWIFNICQEVYTPSLQKLVAMKCHGPVGGEFSYEKLESKRNNRLGCFILRESESKYNDYYIDVCLKDGSKPTTFKLERIPGDEFIFNDDLTKYKDIRQLMEAYKYPNKPIYLQECLPPSEYDVSPLLLCKSETIVGDSMTDSSDINVSVASPLCISSKNLLVFKDKNCLKWNKDRKKVKENGTFISYPKFKNDYFPEDNTADAKKYCRNPNGDIGGPWCFVEDPDTDEIEREYCDIPFCDDPQCMVFTKNFDTYMHYTDFNNTLSNFTFGVKLWDSDSYLEASARLVLSLAALPLTGKEIEEAGVGIEIFIGNNYSALRFGNKDKPEYEVTLGHLKSTMYTLFSLSWHAGFITFGLEGQKKPIFLAEYQTKNNLLGFKKNKFSYYSAQGTNILWYFPFCTDDFDCDVQTTTGKAFQQFWPLRTRDVAHDLYVHVRAFHSAAIAFVPTPTVVFPHVKIVLMGKNNYTRITMREHKQASEVVLKEIQIFNLLYYWEWKEFSISFFADTMNVYVKKALGLQMITEIKNNIFRNLRWFSVSSENTVAHWSFYCVPPVYSNPPPSLLPECALNEDEPNYKGTQDITSEGLPCIPWSSTKLIGVDFKERFKNDSIFKAWNYCRDPFESKKGTYCYTLSLIPERAIEQTMCHLRKCKSEQCRMAGTGNDFIGGVSLSRSNRTCARWDLTNYAENIQLRQLWNDTLFADMSASNAQNFCRNPSRDVAGSWCYTTDSRVVEDICNVRDCDRPEECTIILKTILLDRKVYILPQWKETGMAGGLRFGVKEWNPDLLDGLAISITPQNNNNNEIILQIGADYNEKVRLIRNKQVIIEKTMPHIITAGKWNDLWLQTRKGEIMLGFEGVPTTFLEWKSNNMDQEFEPTFIGFGSIMAYPLGLSFKCDECHTEYVGVHNYERFYPLGLWKEEKPIFNNLTLNMRGAGVILVVFTWLPSNGNYYILKMEIDRGIIFLAKNPHPEKALAWGEIKPVMTPNSWTKLDISFNETTFVVTKDNLTILTYQNPEPMLFYWFTISAEQGWAVWNANCEPLELDGPPRDGGWSAWSPWTCSVTCGGGEGYRTRTCSNPRPNVFGKLCQGPPTATGKCNDFPCGDISPSTLEKIRKYLQKEHFSEIANEGQEKEGSRGITVVVRSLWKVTKGKKTEVALKKLKPEHSDRYLKDFLTLAGQWAFLQSSAIVKLFGISFTSNLSLVMEYFKLGPLDQYLQVNKHIIKEVDLIEAASNLASALWHLTENDIVHGNIRCRKLMVHSHDENSFNVKLTDPGIATEYASSEVHWIPVECYSNLNYARKSTEAEVWSFGTTLWEIFMYGEQIKPIDHVEAMRGYMKGRRLPKPPSCTEELYGLMRECWDMDPHKRKKPQAIMRDINQILYQVYNSRRIHSYSKVFSKPSLQKSTRSTSSLNSNDTESTILVGSVNNLVALCDSNSEACEISSLADRRPDWLDSQELYEDSAYDWSNLIPSFNISTATTSLDSLNSTQSVFELDGNYAVVLQGRIGQGFYGEVYKATMESVGGEDIEPKKVAVKKLKTNTISSCLQDFEREINIMKSLRHPNIVEILGIFREELYLVMEFVPHGSLQSYLKIHRDDLQEAGLLKYALDIAQGMAYLGKKNIVHRDLATRNILVVDENLVKISDFGLAQVIGSNDYYILKTNRELPIKWYAPESLRDGKFSVKSDVWSYGVTLCEMFNYGEEPNLSDIEEVEGLPQQQILLNALEKGDRFPCPPNCQRKIYIRIIYPCWKGDPHERPHFSGLVGEIEDLLKDL